ncbi:hypothetical protein [Methylobacterium nodulans]|uniref:Uncharacterized protein n=1 Tax=Methylobacterium nodulans (strain LMG 21967 / CNCM I-2342 / ORS 2060) TaxID=460265 RepID=B8IRP2_METNO|nr:hypothetical protein [Methylobacterium nodulans]ACL60592.1 conserved hypothetical protein [Methylobacterium nodulans ORS 2060]
MPNLGYTVRKKPDGWGVYRADTGTPVRVNGREQTGLSHESAIELVVSLRVLAFLKAEFGDWPVSNPDTFH